jgi:hypothetical protein
MQPRELGVHHCQQMVQHHQIGTWRDTGVAKRHDLGRPGLQRPDAVIDRIRRGIAIQGIYLGKCDDKLRELMDRDGCRTVRASALEPMARLLLGPSRPASSSR